MVRRVWRWRRRRKNRRLVADPDSPRDTFTSAAEQRSISPRLLHIDQLDSGQHAVFVYRAMGGRHVIQCFDTFSRDFVYRTSWFYPKERVKNIKTKKKQLIYNIFTLASILKRCKKKKQFLTVEKKILNVFWENFGFLLGRILLYGNFQKFSLILLRREEGNIRKGGKMTRR